MGVSMGRHQGFFRVNYPLILFRAQADTTTGIITRAILETNFVCFRIKRSRRIA